MSDVLNRPSGYRVDHIPVEIPPSFYRRGTQPLYAGQPLGGDVENKATYTLRHRHAVFVTLCCYEAILSELIAYNALPDSVYVISEAVLTGDRVTNTDKN